MTLVRTSASLLAQMLTHRAKEKVDAHVASILDLTVKALNDPSVDVRNMGKEAFTQITHLFPTDALRMLMRVSATMRSQLSRQVGDKLPSEAPSEAGHTQLRASSLAELLGEHDVSPSAGGRKGRFSEFRELASIREAAHKMQASYGALPRSAGMEGSPRFFRRAALLVRVSPGVPGAPEPHASVSALLAATAETYAPVRDRWLLSAASACSPLLRSLRAPAQRR